MKIKCLPGYESIISNDFSEAYNLLGDDDISCIFTNEIELKEYVNLILKFRDGYQKYAIYDTTTELPHRVKISSADKKSDPPKVAHPLPGILHKLEALGRRPKINQYLINEIISIVSLINIHIGLRNLTEGYFEVVYSAFYYLNSLLAKYERALESNRNSKIARAEAVLLSYSERIKNSISQQFSSRGYGIYHGYGYPIFACSLLKNYKSNFFDTGAII
jgi:hypothetical protein